jgi:putative transcriptional regulator
MSKRKLHIREAKKILDEKSIGRWLVEGYKEIAADLDRSQRKETSKLTRHHVALNLVPTRYSAKIVKLTRKKLECSQAIFAQFLGVSISAVRNWEQGVNSPEHAARRLMDEIRHDPEYWKGRLRRLALRKRAKAGSSRGI